MILSRRFVYTTAAALSWAIDIVITRTLLKSGNSPYTLLLWVGIFSVPFWAYLAYSKRKEISVLSKRSMVLLVAMGFISSFLVNVAEFFALRYSPAVNFSFLIRMVVPFTIILAYLFLGEALTKRKITLAILLLTGSYLFTTQGKGFSLTRGDFFTLLQAVFIAIGNGVLGKFSTNRMNPLVAATGTFFFGLIPISIFSIVMGGVAVPSQLLLTAALAISIICITIFRFQAYKYSNASYVTMVFSFTPVFVSLIAIPFLGETLTAIQIAGGLLIVFASVLVEALHI